MSEPVKRALVRDRPASYRTIEDMLVAASEVVAPPERLTVTEAARKYVRIKEKNYSGPWSSDKTPYLVEPQDTLMSLEHTGMVFVGPARTGKALPLDTRLPTPTGWTTMGDLREGDVLFDEQGQRCRVVAATEVMHDHDCYRITFDDGSHIDSDGGHRWLVEDRVRKIARVVTTEEMVGNFRSKAFGREINRYRIPLSKPIALPDADLPVHPYLLGLWLGDGFCERAALTLHSGDADHICARLHNLGYSTRRQPLAWAEAERVVVTNPDSAGETLAAGLRTIGVLKGSGVKHIPQVYLRASVEQRRELLRGLMDTDGSVSTGTRTSMFHTTSQEILDGVFELLCSLGIKANQTVHPSTRGTPYYKLTFTACAGEDVFSLPRYVAAINSIKTARREGQTQNRAITAIVPIDSVPVRCIQVDSPSHLFLAGEQMVPTHNTQMVLNWLTHTAICDPMDMLLIHMTQATGREWSLSDLAKLFRNSPEVRSRLVPGRQNDNVHDKSFVSGMRLTIKHPSINELSGKTIPRVWLTDYDRMPLNIDGEGDPWTLAKKRAQTFKRHGMTVAEASPGHPVENPRWIAKTPHEAPPAAGILSLYNDGDRRRWHWRCPSCNESFEPDFKLFQYPKSADVMECAEQVVMICPHNGCIITPDMQYELNLGGRWVGEGQRWNPDGTLTGSPRRADIASFWLKGPAAAFTTWPELVVKYLNAEADYERTGSEEKLKSVTNTDLGLPYTSKAMEAGRLPEELKSRAKFYGERGEVPPGVAFLVTTIDVQAGKNSSFVCHTFGICPNGDIYHVDMWKIRKSRRLDEAGDPRTIDPATYPEDWQVLVEEVIERTYPLGDGSGRRMAVKIVACDSGGAVAEGHRKTTTSDGPIVSTTANAYEFWRWLRDDPMNRRHHLRFHLVKGRRADDGATPTLQRTLPDSHQKDKYAIARGDVPVWLVNSTQAKDMVGNRLGRGDDAEGLRVHFPVWYEEDGSVMNIDWLYQQLTAEVRTAKGWEHPYRNRKNEAFDLLSYCVAILTHPDIRINQLDWNAPPGWANPLWDRNDMVFTPSDSVVAPFQQSSATAVPSTADLGKLLGG